MECGERGQLGIHVTNPAELAVKAVFDCVIPHPLNMVVVLALV